MRVLLIGSGGREHALAWALSASPLLTKLFAAPGNAGICDVAECVTLDVRIMPPSSRSALRRRSTSSSSARRRRSLPGWSTISTPPASAPSVHRRLRRSSKARRASPRTSAARPAFRPRHIGASIDVAAARDYVAAHALPIVVKADGLAAGKGVTVAVTRGEALAALDEIFSAAGASVVIEEFLDGEEASFFALSDGRTVSPSARRRTTSAPSTATKARTPAAWAPIRPRRS